MDTNVKQVLPVFGIQKKETDKALLEQNELISEKQKKAREKIKKERQEEARLLIKNRHE